MDNTLRESIMMAAMEGDLAQLLTLGRDGLDRPFLLGDETLHVLGWTGPPAMPPDASWEDFIHAGLAPGFQWTDDLPAAQSMDLPYGFSVCSVPRPNGGYDWLVDIELTTAQTLHLILSGTDQPMLPPPDAALLGLICLAVRSCMNNRPGIEHYQRFSTEQLLLQLIQNKTFDEPLLRFRAHAVHLESEGYFALLMLDLRGYHPQRNSIATIRTQLSDVLGSNSVIDGEVLTFLVCHNTEEQTELRQLWLKVERILTENKLFGVFSRLFYHLGDFHYHYAQTLDVLRLRFCARPGQCLIACDEMTLYSLIFTLRTPDAPAYPPPPVIRILQQSDQNRKTSYIETLTAYLAHSQKPTPTCAALHIHRNTLDYRLRRIEELTGLDWGDGDLMFRLYFALCAIRYDQLARLQNTL